MIIINENVTTVNQVVEIIILGIQKETFKVGEKIPSQRKLSELLGVSRTVVRESIKILEGRGILISKKNSGTYVKSKFTLNESNLHHSSTYSLSDIVEVSNIIWLASIPLLDELETHEELYKLYENTNRFYESYSSKITNQEKFIYETSFGTNLCKLTKNKLIYNLMIGLLKATAEIDLKLIVGNDNYKNILEIDKNILQSILNGDKERAMFWGKERNLKISKIIDRVSIPTEDKYIIDI